MKAAKKSCAEAGLSVYMDADAHYDIFLGLFSTGTPGSIGTF